MVQSAPLTFVIAVAAMGGIVWAAMQWGHGRQNAILRERLEAAREVNNDYREKLKGASPDEARAQVDELKARLAKLEPKHFSDSERETMLRHLRKAPGVVELTEVGHARPLLDDLLTVFREAGWDVRREMLIWANEPPPYGLTVSVPSIASPSPQVQAILAATDAIDVPRVTVERPSKGKAEVRDASIIVSAG